MWKIGTHFTVKCLPYYEFTRILIDQLAWSHKKKLFQSLTTTHERAIEDGGQEVKTWYPVVLQLHSSDNSSCFFNSG